MYHNDGVSFASPRRVQYFHFEYRYSLCTAVNFSFFLAFYFTTFWLHILARFGARTCRIGTIVYIQLHLHIHNCTQNNHTKHGKHSSTGRCTTASIGWPWSDAGNVSAVTTNHIGVFQRPQTATEQTTLRPLRKQKKGNIQMTHMNREAITSNKPEM